MVKDGQHLKGNSANFALLHLEWWKLIIFQTRQSFVKANSQWNPVPHWRCFWVGAWRKELDSSLNLSTIEQPWKAIHGIVLPPVSVNANGSDIGLFVRAPLHHSFIESHYHNLFECRQSLAFPKGLKNGRKCTLLRPRGPSAVGCVAVCTCFPEFASSQCAEH